MQNSRARCPDCGALLRLYPHWNGYMGCLNPECSNNLQHIKKRGMLDRTVQKNLLIY